MTATLRTHRLGDLSRTQVKDLAATDPIVLPPIGAPSSNTARTCLFMRTSS